MANVKRSLCTEMCVGRVIKRKKVSNCCYDVTVEYFVDSKKYRITEVSRRKLRRVSLAGISLRTYTVYSQPDMVYKLEVPVMYNPAKPSDAHIKGNVGLVEC